MSPEQARGGPDLDPRTDVYSLGATLYEGLTGQPPFAGALHAILRRIVEEDPIPPRRFDQEIPADLETICLKAMAKEPAKRVSDGREIADDLRRWQRNEPIEARPAGRVERGWQWCRRRPLVAGLALALLWSFPAASPAFPGNGRRPSPSAGEPNKNGTAPFVTFARHAKPWTPI